MLKIAFDNDYVYPLEKNHRFPMVKYELIPEQLLREGTCTDENFFIPKMVSDDHVLLTHEKSYFSRLCELSLSKKEQRPIGFPMSKELVTREKKIVGGTIECCNFSMSYGVSMNIAGGTHHAFHNRGEAFCMLNDQAVAANVLIHEINDVNKVLIIDLDVHQGNGTASIFNDQEKVFTFSKAGYKTQKVTLTTSFDNLFWGNLLFGGSIGSSVDSWFTNNAQEYSPNQFYVSMEKN